MGGQSTENSRKPRIWKLGAVPGPEGVTARPLPASAVPPAELNWRRLSRQALPSAARCQRLSPQCTEVM